jgi:hypothetical protein
VRSLVGLYLPMRPAGLSQAFDTRRVDFEHGGASANTLVACRSEFVSIGGKYPVRSHECERGTQECVRHNCAPVTSSLRQATSHQRLHQAGRPSDAGPRPGDHAIAPAHRQDLFFFPPEKH